MRRQRLALRLQARAGPEHGPPRLGAAPGHAPKARDLARPTRRCLRLGMRKAALHRPNRPADGAITERLAVEFGRDREDEGITVTRVKACRSVSDGEKLWTTEQD